MRHDLVVAALALGGLVLFLVILSYCGYQDWGPAR